MGAYSKCKERYVQEPEGNIICSLDSGFCSFGCLMGKLSSLMGKVLIKIKLQSEVLQEMKLLNYFNIKLDSQASKNFAKVKFCFVMVLSNVKTDILESCSCRKSQTAVMQLLKKKH